MSEPIPPKEVFRAAGGIGRLADQLGLDRTTPYAWRNAIPAKHVRRVSEITGLPKHVLRPDLFDPPDAAAQRAGAD